ncbi:MarR family winged helix-turn-helix transcriptional regulator [Paenibacillus sp. GCM10027626]|uniref:MarR family winged helix-turn-helix transcriptional regulator n=1 Tax=Paenibacillus sp. GCM10027626 TaxID=3273411 RepID=UPI003645607A
MPDNHQEEYAQLEQSFIRMKRRMDSEWSKSNFHGLNPMQGRILVRLCEDGSQKASALAEQLFITPGAVTGIADKLLELGLIARDRAEGDRRIVMLSITEKGRELVQELKKTRSAISAMMFSELSTGEIRELTRLIEKIIVSMDTANERREKEHDSI